MNDEIKARLVKYADQLENAASKGADFVSTHAPETVHQYLAWHFWYAVIHAAACFVVCCGSAFACVRLARWAYGMCSKHEDCEPAWILPGAIGAVSLIAATACIGHVGDALKIAVAPNVFILEQLAELVKK